ncbi:dihydroxyacetone kinase subunit DhaK [Schnuerera sp.]|uniref:dihydroxyacetone kinase subunit DhaK n=1 Tax=Schnuerera sp. TaxID=2794844 RepID=UPI002B60AE10|nr:dihydroxyacetone kinase subunit DhaK [Schnuerera sp.]HSH35534.1 dihydroxyacetone kinase subunit DhaK [Schnuerera sp.]
MNSNYADMQSILDGEKVIIVPTIAATDAPTSHSAVLYTPDGAFDDYAYFKQSPSVVLVDTGHEPAHGGFVGLGMLDGAVAGEVFTSPTPEQVLKGIKAVDGGAAEKGLDLENVKRVAEKTIKNVRSMGMSLSPCIVPAVGKPSFEIEKDEMEIGLGIHGEPGIRKEKIKTADQIAAILVDNILNDMKLEKDDEVAVMVNGLGGTPLMELYILNREVHNILDEKGIKIHRTLVGDYMTSLEMTGASISLLKLDGELKQLLDAKADTPAFRNL